MNKTTNLIIRISNRDKEAIKKVAEVKSMSMSELVTSLIRAEINDCEEEVKRHNSKVILED